MRLFTFDKLTLIACCATVALTACGDKPSKDTNPTATIKSSPVTTLTIEQQAQKIEKKTS